MQISSDAVEQVLWLLSLGRVIFLELNGPITASFRLFLSFHCSWQYMGNVKSTDGWIRTADLLVSEATARSTEPQSLPKLGKFVKSSKNWIVNVFGETSTSFSGRRFVGGVLPTSFCQRRFSNVVLPTSFSGRRFVDVVLLASFCRRRFVNVVLSTSFLSRRLDLFQIIFPFSSFCRSRTMPPVHEFSELLKSKGQIIE